MVNGFPLTINSIDRAVEHGRKYDYIAADPIQWSAHGAPTVLGLDPAWGQTSKYGIVILQYIDRRIVVTYATEYSNPDMSEMVSAVATQKLMW